MNRFNIPSVGEHFPGPCTPAELVILGSDAGCPAQGSQCWAPTTRGAVSAPGWERAQEKGEDPTGPEGLATR